MRKENFFRLARPESVVFCHKLGNTAKKRVGLAEFREVADCGKRHIDVGVYQLFAARYFGKIYYSVDYRPETADVRNHPGRIDLAFCHKVNRLNHVVGVASGRAGDVRGRVMNVIEIEHCRKFGVGGTGKEIKATVPRKELVGKLDDERTGEDKHVVAIPRLRKSQDAKASRFAVLT